MNVTFQHFVCTVLIALPASSLFTSSVRAKMSNVASSTVGDQVPAVSISVSSGSVSFGDLRPGQASGAVPDVVTNDVTSAVNLTATMEDDGEEDIFESGITINDQRWGDYCAHIASDEDEVMGLVLNVPGEVASVGEVKGSLTLWAKALPLSADFSADVTYGLAPLTVRFTDRSTNIPSSWKWYFNNSGTVDSEEQDPVWTYSEAGTYTATKTAYIEVSA